MHALYQNIAIFVFEGIAAVKAIRSIRKWYETDPFVFFSHSPTCVPVPFGLQGIHTFWGGTKDSVFGTDNTVFATLSVLETNKNFAQSSPN